MLTERMLQKHPVTEEILAEKDDSALSAGSPAKESSLGLKELDSDSVMYGRRRDRMSATGQRRRVDYWYVGGRRRRVTVEGRITPRGHRRISVVARMGYPDRSDWWVQEASFRLHPGNQTELDWLSSPRARVNDADRQKFPIAPMFPLLEQLQWD